MNRIYCTVTALLLCATAAVARNEDGTLGLLQTPHNGLPAIVTAGSAFPVVARDKAELTIKSESNAHALTVEWVPQTNGGFVGTCTVPEGVAAGAYALHAVAASGEDTNSRTVYIVESFPTEYVLAHVTDTHIGKPRPRGAEAIITDVFANVNQSDAAFVLVTGDVTENGSVEQFQGFLRVLDTCERPTFVVAGNHDRQALNYEAFFGPPAYFFRFGPDGYLGFDTKDFNVADDLVAQPGALEVYRRELADSRWAIGFSHRYEPDMGMRGQLVLFVDNPLDHFIFGHWHRANTKAQRAVPWGDTRITVTPAAINGEMRYFDINAAGIHPRDPEKVTTIE